MHAQPKVYSKTRKLRYQYYYGEDVSIDTIAMMKKQEQN